METPVYEGGIGGKLRRRTLRRPAATPYDRPLAAARGLRGPPPEPGGSGWLAKLVDPASRLIVSSASRLLSSVFRKRLAAPPAVEAPGENFQSRQEVTEATSDELSAELQENKADSENNVTNNSDSNTVLEFEQLLKQKTFTRVQFEHLTEILRSRTVDLDNSIPTDNDKKLDDINVPNPAKEIESSRSHEDLATPADILAIPDDQAASPVELAKAYMGSRVSKASPRALSWQSHLFHENKRVPSNSTYAIKPFDLKGPRSVVRFSGSAEISESSYMTPRSCGRSAMYGMSCSPYFKGEGSSKDGYAGSSSLQTPESTRQVLKRRSSVLDSDFGSFGPIRRIRQKFSVTSSKKVMHSALPGNLHPSPSSPFKKDVHDDSSLIQKPICSNEQDKTVGNSISNSAVAPVLPQSSEMENKILQQLVKLVPSPKEKSSKLKDNPLDGSPPYMMHAFSKGISNSLSHKQEGVEGREENGPSTSISGGKSRYEANNMPVGVIPATAAVFDKDADVMISDSVAVSACQKPAFQMSSPEDTLPNDTNTLLDPTCQLKNRDEVKMLPDKAVRPSIMTTEGSPQIASARTPSSSSDFYKAKTADLELSIDSVAENGKGFTFPFVTASSASQPPPTPTMPSPLVEKSVAQIGQIAAPLFNFGSKNTNRVEFSSTTSTSNFDTTSGLGNGISNAQTSAMLKGLNSDKGEGQISKNLSKSVGDVDSTDNSTSNIPIVFSFGAYRNESFRNGSPNSFSTSATPGTTLSGSTGSMIFSTTAPVLASSSCASASSEARKFSTVPPLQFGSTSSMASSASVSQPLDESNATDLEGKPGKASPFSINCATPGSAAVFKFGGNSSSAPMAVSQFSRADSGSVLAASTVSITGSSSAAPALSTLFSSADSNQSALTPTFSGASSSILKFGSTQSNNLGSLVVDNSTKTSTSVTVTGFDGTRSTEAESGKSSESSASQFGSFYSSPTFGMNVSSLSSLSSSQVGAATTGSKPFSSSSIFSFSVGAGSSSISATSSFAPAANSSVFGSTFQSSTSSAFGSSASSPSTGLTFGVSASGSLPFMFGSPSPPVSSFNSAGASTSSISSGHPAFGLLNSVVCFSSGTPTTDRMNVEDGMAEDTNQSVASMVPQFGRPGTSSNIPAFGAPVIQSASPVFQFGSHQNSSFPPSPSPFQASSSVEFPQGGSFSLGSGGGDKSGRKIVRIRRDKLRKK